MQQIAHRGIHGAHPENTLAAFESAVEVGILAVETDLRLAADGRIVLFHDRFVGERSVATLTRAELSQATGYPVPTLQEALAAFPQIHWVLELKTHDVLPPTLAALAPLRESHQLMLISFWHRLIIEAAAQIEIEMGFTLGSPPLGFLAAAQAAREQYAQINTLVWNYEFLDAGMVTEAQRKSWRNMVFNTISAADNLHCLAMNVDGVITDNPTLGPPPSDVATG